MKTDIVVDLDLDQTLEIRNDPEITGSISKGPIILIVDHQADHMIGMKRVTVKKEANPSI